MSFYLTLEIAPEAPRGRTYTRSISEKPSRPRVYIYVISFSSFFLRLPMIFSIRVASPSLAVTNYINAIARARACRASVSSFFLERELQCLPRDCPAPGTNRAGASGGIAAESPRQTRFKAAARLAQCRIREREMMSRANPTNCRSLMAIRFVGGLLYVLHSFEFSN